MPAVDTEAVLRFIKARGPVLPVQVAKEIHQNLMMAGAVLSEMVSSGKLRVSKLKIGGSPLYYAVGQENRLTGFTQHLGSKERATYETLRGAGVIQDHATDALTRVTLRAIKDFAIPLTVTLEGQQEIFWKYFLLSDSEAESKIKSLLGLNQPITQTTEGQTAETGVQEIQSSATDDSDPTHPAVTNPPSQSFEPRPIPSPKPVKPFMSGDEYDDEKPARTQQATIFEAASKATASPKEASEPTPQIGEPPKEEKTSPESAPSQDAQPAAETPPAPSPEPQKEKSPAVAKTSKRRVSKKPAQHTEKHDSEPQECHAPQDAQEPSLSETFNDDSFYRRISSFLSSNSIEVLTASCNKKGQDYDLVISLTSSLGAIKMHCKALNKKSVGESDLTGAFAKSQLNNLPGILIATGQPTKKAQAMLETKLHGLTFKTI